MTQARQVDRRTSGTSTAESEALVTIVLTSKIVYKLNIGDLNLDHSLYSLLAIVRFGRSHRIGSLGHIAR
jgi:hypothetical protein